MSTPNARAANLLGALALAVGDVVDGVAVAATAHGGATPGALVAIGHAPGLSIDQLSRVLRLSHPGTVRLVDRLSGDGLVERRSGQDRRRVALHLTPSGRLRRSALLAARAVRLQATLAVLSESERAALERITAKLLAAMPTDPLHGLSICRLCDERSCPECPVDAGIAIAGC